MGKNSQRNRATTVRFENLTAEEQHEVGNKIREIKKEVAPESRATMVEGSNKELSGRPMTSLESNDE